MRYSVHKLLPIAFLVLSVNSNDQSLPELKFSSMTSISQDFVSWFKDSFDKDSGSELNRTFSVANMNRDAFRQGPKADTLNKELYNDRDYRYNPDNNYVWSRFFSLVVNQGTNIEIKGISQLFRLNLASIDLEDYILDGWPLMSSISGAERRLKGKNMNTTGANIIRELLTDRVVTEAAIFSEQAKTIEVPLSIEQDSVRLILHYTVA